MKILFDSQIFDSQKYGGISRYFSELFKNLKEGKKVEFELPIVDTENIYINKIYPHTKRQSIKKFQASNINNRFLRIFRRLIAVLDKKSNRNESNRAILAQNFDLFHPTYYSTYFIKSLGNKPFVLTVHDMIHEIYPKNFLFRAIPIVNCKRSLIKKASKIIAVSEHTKNDILRFYNIPEEKIKVIYHGNSIVPSLTIPNDMPKIPNKYILFVGARDNYKNFIFFIESISPLLKKDSSLNIIAAGGYSSNNTFRKSEINLFDKLGIKEQMFQYSLNDEMLANLYKRAICFVFPSLYEGFGIPVLESFACECPAVISNTSSLPEVGGKAAIYFDPKDRDSILESVERVICDKNLRLKMIEDGKEQLKKFSWNKTAEETTAVYSEVLKNN